MRILFLSPSVPSRLHRIRTVHLLQVLARRNEVRVLCLAPTRDQATAHPRSDTVQLPKLYSSTTSEVVPHSVNVPLRVIPHPIAASLASCLVHLGRQPLEISYCASPAMAAAVREELGTFRPDLLYVKRLRAAQFVPPSTMLPTLLDVTDAVSLSHRRAQRVSPWYVQPLYWHEARTYERYEQMLAQQFSHWIVASPLEAHALRTTLPSSTRVSVVPNVVDTEFFSPKPEPEAPSTLLFSGLLDKEVNVSAIAWFARAVFPRIRARLPDVRLTICGPRPRWTVRNLARVPGVTVRGWVPDLRDEIARATAVIAPVLTGTGTRNKILQAWAMGKAIVATPAAAEGLEAVSGHNLLLTQDEASFAAAVVLLLTDRRLRKSLGAQGRATVQKTYDLAALERALLPLLANVTHTSLNHPVMAGEAKQSPHDAGLPRRPAHQRDSSP